MKKKKKKKKKQGNHETAEEREGKYPKGKLHAAERLAAPSAPGSKGGRLVSMGFLFNNRALNSRQTPNVLPITGWRES